MFRVGIWAAVSTKPQAKDDKPLEQVERCRALLRQRGWAEAVEPYVVPGESRERFINLRDAEDQIPQLRAMLDAAQAGRINLVVTVDYNRFRGLTDAVYKTLAAYGCQLYALAQPVEPQPPDQFDAYSSDTATLLVGMSQIVSNTQITDVRRRYKSGMPARITKYGLHAASVPYGYQKPAVTSRDQKPALVQKPSEVETILWMKTQVIDLGRSATAVSRELTERKVPTPKGGRVWYWQTVWDILTNPYYAGLVAWGKSRVLRDPRTGKKKRRRLADPRDWQTNTGKHVPLWSEDEWRRILQVRDDRARANRGATKRTHTWSRLLVCRHGQHKLYAHKHDAQKPADGYRYHDYDCYKRECAHPARITDAELAAVVPGMLRDLARRERADIERQRARHTPTLARDEARRRDSLRRQLAALTDRKARYQRAWGDGLLGYEDFQDRLGELATERERLEQALAALDDRAGRLARREARVQALETLLLRLPDDLVDEDPAVMNHRLSEFIAAVEVDGDAVAAIRLRGN